MSVKHKFHCSVKHCDDSAYWPIVTVPGQLSDKTISFQVCKTHGEWSIARVIKSMKTAEDTQPEVTTCDVCKKEVKTQDVFVHAAKIMICHLCFGSAPVKAVINTAGVSLDA